MENINIFPTGAGFLFPNGKYFSTDGRGHQRLAFKILENEYGMDVFKVSDPELILQEKYSAILIRYRWGEKLIYLPKTVPGTWEGRAFFRKAVKFYRSNNFQIMNLYKISLIDDFSIINSFIQEDFEEGKIFTNCMNYTNTVIVNSIGEYAYNPERIGD